MIPQLSIGFEQDEYSVQDEVPLFFRDEIVVVIICCVIIAAGALVV